MKQTDDSHYDSVDKIGELYDALPLYTKRSDIAFYVEEGVKSGGPVLEAGCGTVYHVTNPDGSKERVVHDFEMRWFFRYEVEHLLARTGFVLRTMYGNFDRSAFADTSPEMIFVAERL